MSTKISIVNVSEHESISDAVVETIKLLEKDLPFNFLDSEKILLKPNLLIAKEDACTQPIMVEGVLSYLKEIGVKINNISIGDSPGQSKKFASDVAKEIGLYEVCEKNGINFIDFEIDVPVIEEIEGALKMKQFRVAKAVKDSEIIINLPRLKTHAEATITGAIKNYWGIIPGGLKAKFHLLGKTAEEFGEVLADNFSWIVQNKPKRLTIFDLETIMEGSKGPSFGKMVNWGLILAGTDELALDVVALEIGKFKAKNVPHLKNAMERNLGIGNLDDIEILGLPLEEAKKLVPKFNVPGNRMTNFISYITGHVVYKIVKKIPDLIKKKCAKCGQCAEICPAEAINFEIDTFPEFLRKKCISCLCCAELCVQNAIKTKKRGLVGLFD